MADAQPPAAHPDLYRPSPEILQHAWIKDYDTVYRRSLADPEGFWGDIAKELEWARPWDRLHEWTYPFAKWFVGAKCNIVHNALDRHVKTWRKNKLALIWEGENGDARTFTYFELYREVNRFASVLKSMGINRGDRVTIYLPRIPELPIAMLACAKIGAMHSVVYGGFSVDALRDRILDAESKLLITADGGFMNGKTVQLKQLADEAVAKSPCVEILIVVKRTGQQVPMEPGRDLWYHELMNLPIASPRCPTEVMDAEDPLFMLYTSGTTGKPKGILHTHGGYMVGTYITLKWIFDLKDNDTYWCAADPGWITGHSYIVYGPLLNGATTFLYEGGPSFPYPNRWWSMVERYGINILYTAPTAIRGLMRFGEAWPNRHDLSSLRILGSVGEPINPEAWRWYHRVIGRGRCPIMDTWWQTETGMILASPLPCTPLKPGSATFAFPGVEIDVVDEKGNPVPANTDGLLVVKRPWPAMMRTIYKDPERYTQLYWNKVPGVYTTGDSARKDADGYIWVIGRVDDVIKVSGYRLGTAEIESALITHASVAESAVIGKPHELKGHAIKAFVVLRPGHVASDALVEELRQHVAHQLGPIAKPEEIQFLPTLPKTRSGKIMRRLLKAREMGLAEGDTSTLEE